MVFSPYFMVLVPAVISIQVVKFSALNHRSPGLAAVAFGALAGRQSLPTHAIERKLKPLQSRVMQAGGHCEQRANDLSHVRLLRCRSESMGRSE